MTEIYPRYRFLRRRLAEFLDQEGLPANVPHSTLAVSLVPAPAPNSRIGEALPTDPESSRGAAILPIEELTQRSEYYRRLASHYRIEHCLLTNKDTVVGPDAGILTTACAAAQTFPGRIRVIEFGTGAGTTAVALASLEKLACYLGNDFSPEVNEFFGTTVRPRLTLEGIDCEFVAGSCFALEFSTRADLIIVGVFYQAQPELLKLKGRAMGACLSGHGVLVIQSSKPENQFITELLMDDPARHAGWPWYDKAFSIAQYFRHVAKLDVYDETMLIASDNAARVDNVAAMLQPIKSASA
ncbi:MAG: class I SAM-dependent methyltransferase [Candidatus Sulfotelmatobacter sp.]